MSMVLGFGFGFWTPVIDHKNQYETNTKHPTSISTKSQEHTEHSNGSREKDRERIIQFTAKRIIQQHDLHVSNSSCYYGRR